jgi:hypothetical protein
MCEQKYRQGQILIYFACSSCLLSDDCWKIHEFSSVIIIPPWLSITWGMNNRPVGGRSSETVPQQRHHHNVIVVIIILLFCVFMKLNLSQQGRKEEYF